MINILGIHLAATNNFIYLPIFLIFIFLAIKNYVRIKNGIKLLVHQQNRALILKNFSLFRKLIKTILLCASLFFIFIALLQPQWGKKDQVITQEGRDLLILLDVSQSMLAQDFKPNRLEFAKLKVRALLSRLTFERVGLIAFSGSAFVQCPLTVDHKTFFMFLDHLNTQSIASGTTAIDTALLKAIEVFSQSTDRKNKNVVLFTDGEDFSMNLEVIKQKSKEQNIRLFALGIGSEQGAPIPNLDSSGKVSGHITDEKGQIVLSILNEDLLKSTCSTLDGFYSKTTYEDSDLDEIVDVIQKMEKEKFSEKKLSLYEDHYPWFLGIAWLLLILEWLL